MKTHIKAPKARKVHSYHTNDTELKNNQTPCSKEYNHNEKYIMLEKRNSNPFELQGRASMERIRFEFEESADKLDVIDEVMQIMSNPDCNTKQVQISNNKPQEEVSKKVIHACEQPKDNFKHNDELSLENRKKRSNCITSKHKHNKSKDLKSSLQEAFNEMQKDKAVIQTSNKSYNESCVKTELKSKLRYDFSLSLSNDEGHKLGNYGNKSVLILNSNYKCILNSSLTFTEVYG